MPLSQLANWKPPPPYQLDYSSCSVRVCRNTASNRNCYSCCPSNCNNNQHIRLVLALERIDKGKHVSPQRDKELRAKIWGCFCVLKQTFQGTRVFQCNFHRFSQLKSFEKIDPSLLSNKSQKIQTPRKSDVNV